MNDNNNDINIEDASLKRVQEMGLLDNLEPESRYDVFTQKAVNTLGVPISTLTILDDKKEHYKSCVGLDTKEGEKAISFCAQAFLSKDLYMIPDCSKDPKFANNPMVVGSPFIKFYAGMAIHDHKTGLPIAVFCIKDTKPRELSLEDISTFIELAGEVEKEMNG